MPKQYVAIKEKLLKEGKSPEKAKETAAKIYNAKGKGHVGRGSK